MNANFLIVLLILSCSTKENMYERDERLIGEYHRQIMEERGRKYLFISKEDAKAIYENKNEVSISNARPEDKVIFIDIEGNVIYQAMIINNSTSKPPTIVCLDLDTFEKYETDLSVDKLKGCDNHLIASFKILR